MEKVNLFGVLVLVILLSSGGTYYVQDAGTKTSCKAGWEYVMNGTNEGYYSCQTSTSIRYELCFEVTNSSNTQNYWCQRGNLVVLNQTIELEIPNINQTIGKQWLCPAYGKPCIEK